MIDISAVLQIKCRTTILSVCSGLACYATIIQQRTKLMVRVQTSAVLQSVIQIVCEDSEPGK